MEIGLVATMLLKTTKLIIILLNAGFGQIVNLTFDSVFHSL